MKKLFLILLLLICFQCRGQNNQYLELRFPYTPDEIFLWENFNVCGQYFFGSESVKWGAFATASFKENDYLFGVNNRTLLARVEGANIFVEGGAAVLADKSNDDAFGEDFHRHYIYYAVRLSFPIKHNVDLNYGFEQQYWGSESSFVTGVGASYKLR